MKTLRELVAELRRLCETATAAPWVHGCDEDPPLEDISAESGAVAMVMPHANVRTAMRTGEHFSHSDARLIVAARNGLGQLLDAADENERLRALLGEALPWVQAGAEFENTEQEARKLANSIEAALRPQAGEAGETKFLRPKTAPG